MNWEYVYKGTIRDFYPPTKHIEESKNAFQIYIESIDSIDVEDYNKLISEVGRPLDAVGLKSKIDFAFLALHGSYGEDGQVLGSDFYDFSWVPYLWAVEHHNGLTYSSCISTGLYVTQLDIDKPYTVSEENILYKCGWSPFSGKTFNSSIYMTIVNGHVAFKDGQITENLPFGMQIEFDR